MAERPPDEGADLGRRMFFRRFAGDVVSAASSAIGVLGVLQETSADAARELLAGDEETDAQPTGFRSAFRWDGDVCYVVDQRKLPETFTEYSIRGAAEAAFAIREGVVRGAPVARQLAAVGLALTAHRHRATRPYARRAQLRGSANGVRVARPALAAVGVVVDRMLATLDAVGALEADGERLAGALRAEAEAIILEATTDHGLLAAAGAAALPTATAALPPPIADPAPAPADEQPIRIVTHGYGGLLAGGQYGTALAIVVSAHHAGRPVQVHVAETRPELLGSRLGAWELREAGVPFDVTTDAGAATLLARGQGDVLLLAAERIAANGDALVVTGGYALAVVAARHGIPVLVAAPTSLIDLESSDGTAFPEEMRRTEGVTTVRGVPVAAAGSRAVDPALEVVPAELVTGLVTDSGVLRAPYEPVLRTAVADAEDRHAVLPRFPGAVDRPPPDAADPGPALPLEVAG